MNDLIIEGKPLGNTPTIEFKTNGEFNICGRSIPEDTRKVYTPIFTWLDSFQCMLPANIELKVSLEYFNTSSSIHLLTLFNYLAQLHQKKKTNVIISWFYCADDDEMFDAGNDFKGIVRVPFNVVKIS